MLVAKYKISKDSGIDKQFLLENVENDEKAIALESMFLEMSKVAIARKCTNQKFISAPLRSVLFLLIVKEKDFRDLEIQKPWKVKVV